jgi:transposase
MDSFNVVVKNASFDILSSGIFLNHNTGFEKFMDFLYSLNVENDYTIKVAVECTACYHQALVKFLQSKGIEVFVYNAQTARNIAKAYLKEKKTDTLDAEILANLLIDGKFPISMTHAENQFIQIRSYSRRLSGLGERIAMVKTKLKDELAQASKGMLYVFEKQSVFNKAPIQLMKLYPLPTDRIAAGIDEITQVLAFHSNNKYGMAEALKLLEFDAENQGDKELFFYFRQSILDYIEEIQYLQKKREQYLKIISALTEELKEAQNLMSLVGVGITLMPIILGEVGNIHRFPKAEKFVGYAGLAPVEHESGPYKGEKHLKKGGCPRLSHAFYMIANCARRYDERLKNLYQRVKGRHINSGKPKGIAHIIANCAVAREIAILVYNILKYNRKYYQNPKDYKDYKASLKS